MLIDNDKNQSFAPTLAQAACAEFISVSACAIFLVHYVKPPTILCIANRQNNGNFTYRCSL